MLKILALDLVYKYISLVCVLGTTKLLEDFRPLCAVFHTIMSKCMYTTTYRANQLRHTVNREELNLEAKLVLNFTKNMGHIHQEYMSFVQIFSNAFST